MKSESMYIGHKQGKLSQWVKLRPIFELCTGKQFYGGGGWRQEALDVIPRANLEYILQ